MARDSSLPRFSSLPFPLVSATGDRRQVTIVRNHSHSRRSFVDPLLRHAASTFPHSNHPIADGVEDFHAGIFIQLHRAVDLTRGDQILVSISAESDRPFTPAFVVDQVATEGATVDVHLAAIHGVTDLNFDRIVVAHGDPTVDDAQAGFIGAMASDR